MKKFTMLFFLSFLALGIMAQRPAKRVATQDQLKQKDDYSVLLKQLTQETETPVKANKVSPVGQNGNQGGAALAASAVNPVALGRLSNAFSVLRTEQNQLIAVDSLNLVAWIHRQDVTLYGGGGTANGKYRYDISTDGGITWSTDIGPLQTTYTNYGRYPNITAWNNSGGSDPLGANLLWCGPTNKFPTPGWVGHVYGKANVTTSNPVTSTEKYLFDADPTLLPGGMCQGMPGEFWTTEFDANTDQIYLYKGTYNTGTSDFDWAREVTFSPNHYQGAGGAAIGPNLAFSPDGMNGYVVWLGDIVGGHDSLLSPCYYQTTDGGATWDTAATEIDLRNIPWIYDSLTTFWVTIDSVTGDTIPSGSGNPTTGFDFDVIVDMNGNLHISCIVGNGSVPGGDPPGYSIYSGINKFLIDIFTPDGGTTWDADYIAPILAFRGEFGTPDPSDGSLITQDNFVQMSRTEDGTRVFFSWVDSDTSVIGFGENSNLAPNLRIAGKRITDGTQTCWKRITDGDALWDGLILWPSMSPIVLSAASGNRHYLPIAWLQMLNNDQSAPCQGFYIGNEAQILESDFKDPATLNLSFDANCFPVFVNQEPAEPTGVTLHPSYPNPATNEVTIAFDLVKSEQINLTVRNLYGQTLINVAQGVYKAGKHKVTVNTSDLAQGVYLYSLQTSASTFTNKMVIVK
ncbi:MAG: T9SS type A sorting domain-containing protein [Bacteroidia bacterium]|nr:T9SS type A sorting domain-containing protein [Bacteroidia bacterium]